MYSIFPKCKMEAEKASQKIIRGGQAWRARVWLLRLKVRQFVLQDLCKEIHAKIEMVDEERYDCEAKINELNLKVQDLGGKFKKPALRKARVPVDEMMRALFGAKNKGSMDLRANLKSVKKEDIKQEKVGGWRKDVEAMSGMEGGKKMFDA
uniref:Uncharacterized protein n=1 Tax=Mola mola TaxID=94237 RepID=A0A3Q3W8N8_MOLML